MDPWRILPHASWYDPYAAMENPKSAEFKDAIREEIVLWKKAIRQHKSIIRYRGNVISAYYATAIPAEPQFAQEQFIWQDRKVFVQYGVGHRVNVWIEAAAAAAAIVHAILTSFGVDPESQLYYIIQDIGHGAELYELQVYNVSSAKPLWKHSPVGPSAAFKGSNIYFQTVENALRYPGIIMADAETGKSQRQIFHEDDAWFNVELIKPHGQPDIFIKTNNALSQRIGRIVGSSGIDWITPAILKDANGSGGSLFPISAHTYGTNSSICHNGKHYELPRHMFLTDAIIHSDNSILISTTHQACESLYSFDMSTHNFTCVFKSTYPNSVRLIPDGKTLEITSPNKPTRVYTFEGNGLKLKFKMNCPLKLPYFKFGTALSKDGTEIPFTYVSHYKHPTRLLVEAYGAYGISGHRAYPIRWLDWLRRGYAVVVAFPRGGREDGDAWYDGGRTAQRKHNTFDDTAAVIDHVQRYYKFKPKHTVFYGRSAGGWLAAIIAQKYSHYVGAVYAEVPYLDVLRTSSNPSLPLTQLEYDEFGHPAERREDYLSLQTISPIDIVAPAPLLGGGPTIIVKTAINDMQVYPYEALKWAKKLRQHGWNVHVGIDGDGGHFAAPDVRAIQQAEDSVLIDQALGTGGRRGTLKLRNHTSKGVTRRKRASS